MRKYGDPEVLEAGEIDRPEPIQTEVLVRVTAAGLNPVDWKIRRYGGDPRAVGEPPLVLGWDVAGVVEEAAGRVTRFAPGDRVFGMPWFPRLARAYAEYVTAPARQLARTPGGLTDVEAGGLPLAGLTAWQSLVDVAEVGAGDRVLIHAAAGGVGHIAVQIAKARGAYVMGTARGDRRDFLVDIGIDEPIDYTSARFEEIASDVDVVLDPIGTEDYGLRSLRTLREGGLLIVLPGGVPEAVATAARDQRLRTTGIQVEPDYCALESLAALVDDGKLTVAIDETFPLAEASQAHRFLEQGRAKGKVVLTI